MANSTFHSYRSNMGTHVLPALGTRPVQQLTAAMLNALYAELLARGNGRGPLSAKTVNYIHTTIHKALADAVDAGVVGRNVAERAKPPRPARRAAREIRCREAGDLARFLDHVRGVRLEAAWRARRNDGHAPRRDPRSALARRIWTPRGSQSATQWSRFLRRARIDAELAPGSRD